MASSVLATESDFGRSAAGARGFAEKRAKW